MSRTVVHLVRHGEVYNPGKVLYGRLPGFGLSDLGHAMAERIRDHFQDQQIARVVASPLQRAKETATPLALALHREIDIDPDLIEAENVFEGMRVTGKQSVLRKPSSWRYLWNPFRPSWGEPHIDIAARMRTALERARLAAPGEQSVLISHQLPIWIARLDAEHQHLWHDPRKRQCALASVTTFRYDGQRLAEISYTEPAADLAARAAKVPGA